MVPVVVSGPFVVSAPFVVPVLAVLHVFVSVTAVREITLATDFDGLPFGLAAHT